MPPLRITFINPCGNIGGAERSLLLLLEQLDRARYTPTVICPEAGRLLNALTRIEVPARLVPLGDAEKLSRFSDEPGLAPFLSATAELGRAFRRLLPQLRATRPDLIHTNGIKAHLIGGLCGRLLRRPVLWHMRDLVPEGLMRAVFRASADCLPRRIVANSRAVAAQFAGCRAARCTSVVHNAVDLARFQPTRTATAVRTELGFAPDTIVLGMVAHFTRWKGHLLFLEVLARLIHHRLPVGALIVGSSIYRTNGHDGYEDEVRARCRELGLADRVVFTGYQECVADFLNAADILVHPPTRPEPFGRVVIEAMALAKPVVAAAAGGVLEIVEPGITGLLAPPGDARAFEGAVRTLVCDSSQRMALGQAGRRQVESRFNPAEHLHGIERVYAEIAA